MAPPPIPDFAQVQVLVTGGAGFIGSHLVDALVERGAQVRVLDDFSTGLRSNLEPSRPEVEVLEGDLRSLRTCLEACDGARYVFHQGALGSVPRSIQDPATSLAVNAGGTANLFTAARDQGVARLVYASSSSVYGDSETLPKREGEEGSALSPYALSKWMCEETAEIFARCYGLESVGLRYFNVFGPRQRPDGPYAAVIPRFFGAYLSGGRPVIYGDGEQSRDFTFVADAVRANLLAAGAAASACGRAYTVAGGRRVSLNELLRAIRQLLSGGAGPEPSYEDPRPGDVRHSLAELAAIEGGLGYRPATSVEDGLALTCEYYASLHAAAATP
ncbi:MAG: NAD-dependent epimerase/dehydratase family protein [Acidobacteriota bacterium]